MKPTFVPHALQCMLAEKRPVTHDPKIIPPIQGIEPTNTARKRKLLPSSFSFNQAQIFTILATFNHKYIHACFKNLLAIITQKKGVHWHFPELWHQFLHINYCMYRQYGSSLITFAGKLKRSRNTGQMFMSGNHVYFVTIGQLPGLIFVLYHVLKRLLAENQASAFSILLANSNVHWNLDYQLNS